MYVLPVYVTGAATRIYHVCSWVFEAPARNNIYVRRAKRRGEEDACRKFNPKIYSKRATRVKVPLSFGSIRPNITNAAFRGPQGRAIARSTPFLRQTIVEPILGGEKKIYHTNWHCRIRDCRWRTYRRGRCLRLAKHLLSRCILRLS